MLEKEQVEELKSYRELQDKLIYLNNRIQGLHSIDFDKKGSGKRISLEELIDQKIQVTKQMESIEDKINQLDNVYERLVLGYRYIQFWTIEKIAEKLGYSTRHIARICKQAIKNLK